MKRIIIICLALLFPTATSAQIIISEIMYDPAGVDSGHEWAELYNAGSDSAVINSDWRFSDGANHTLNLVQGTSTLAAGQFAVLVDNASIFLSEHPDYAGWLF